MIAQIGIFIFGMGAVWLANDSRAHIRRFGCLAGLMAQPFWFYTTVTHQQWGIFVSSFFYTYSWSRGFYNQWIRPSARP